MNWIRSILRRWPVVAAALIAAGIVHIVTVFALPWFYRSDAYGRIARTLPPNTFVILPVAGPRAQVLPFQLPDSRYAICRFDLRAGPLLVRATLTEPGWTLSAYTTAGESFYVLPATEQRKLELSLLLLPAGERFLGNLSSIPGITQDTAQIQTPTRNGLVVIQAPHKGRSYAPHTEAQLSSAACSSATL